LELTAEAEKLINEIDQHLNDKPHLPKVQKQKVMKQILPLLKTLLRTVQKWTELKKEIDERERVRLLREEMQDKQQEGERRETQEASV
jgi:hypothetical protein